MYLPPAKFHTLQRLTRQRQRLEKEITARKNRISALIDSYLPGLWRVFSDPWSPQARTFYCCKLNPFAVVQVGEEALHSFLAEAAYRSKGCLAEARQVYAACHNIATLYELSAEAGIVDEGFFADFQEEIARELRLMEAEETEAEAIAEHVEELYRKLHPQDYLRTIPGVIPAEGIFVKWQQRIRGCWRFTGHMRQLMLLNLGVLLSPPKTQSTQSVSRNQADSRVTRGVSQSCTLCNQNPAVFWQG